MRRALLSLGVLGLAVLCVRRVHANDPSTVSVGGSYAEHDAHLTCGPDVRVRHASGGAQVHKVFGDDGTGFVVDARGGAGSTTITKIYDEEAPPPGSTQSPRGTAPTRWAGGGQIGIGYSWRSFGFALGGGYFAAAEDAYREDAGRYTHIVMPTAAFRFGQGKPFSGEAGLGAPPVPGLARFWSLYTDAQFRVDESVNAGFGTYVVLFNDLQQRSGFYGRGGYMLTPAIQLGGFLGVETTFDKDRRIGFATGLGLTFTLDPPKSE